LVPPAKSLSRITVNFAGDGEDFKSNAKYPNSIGNQAKSTVPGRYPIVTASIQKMSIFLRESD